MEDEACDDSNNSSYAKVNVECLQIMSLVGHLKKNAQIPQILQATSMAKGDQTECNVPDVGEAQRPLESNQTAL